MCISPSAKYYAHFALFTASNITRQLRNFIFNRYAKKLSVITRRGIASRGFILAEGPQRANQLS
jgi:hypothetical protein